MTAGAQSLDDLTSQDEVILRRGQPAPFYGVLTPEQRYRVKEEALEICDIMQTTEPCRPEECSFTRKSIVMTAVTFLVIGLGAGAAATALATVK